MSDEKKAVDEINSRETGPSSIRCPLLTNTNYMVWSLPMKVTLKVHKVWETIEPGIKDEEKITWQLLCYYNLYLKL